jgi:hypothetical protein
LTEEEFTKLKANLIGGKKGVELEQGQTSQFNDDGEREVVIKPPEPIWILGWLARVAGVYVLFRIATIILVFVAVIGLIWAFAPGHDYLPPCGQFLHPPQCRPNQPNLVSQPSPYPPCVSDSNGYVTCPDLKK